VPTRIDSLSNNEDRAVGTFGTPQLITAIDNMIIICSFNRFL